MLRLIISIPTIILFYASMTCIHTPSVLVRNPVQLSLHMGRTGIPDSYRLSNISDIIPEQNQDHSAPTTLPEKSFGNSRAKEESNQYKTEIYNASIPVFTRGIYITNNVGHSKSRLASFIQQAEKYKLNTFVVDVQKKMIPREHVEMIRKAGIFPVARVVVFETGLKQKDVPPGYIEQVLRTIEDASYQGFLEVQLDYIRYADMPELEKLPLAYKYGVINNILKRAQDKANSLAIYLSADVFGRITLNQHDHIGQKLENFASHLDTIYPMVYPSHYTNDPYRIGHPYETVKEGVKNSVSRCNKTRVVAYIQPFSMKLETSGKSLPEYIRLQMEAVEDAGGQGWVIWNARNDYSTSYRAMEMQNPPDKKRYLSEQVEPVSEIDRNM